MPPASRPPVDLRNDANHPLVLRYAEVHESALLDGCLAHGRAQPSLCMNTSTPFYRAARLAVEHGIDRPDAVDLVREALRAYYDQVQPASAAEWLGLGADAAVALQTAPPWAAVFPWRARTLDSYRMAYEKAAYEENRATGRDRGIEDGWLFCGPVSGEKMQIEAERIVYVLRRIAHTGYQRSDDPDGDVKATALVNENMEWRWLITAGNHRASAAAALGYASIPIRVNLVISRADAPFWRHVRERLFSLSQALSIFDNIFNGRPTPLADAWLRNPA
ncbi:hypothetical protein [Bordetella genomosp. 7]|uniref:Uncharacterized protein n=1 Tax=Bordetella genomosp. 7 TaxID=1416805 RepID=A0A261RBT3_9BORD|nr:hypothetical protein [Bordetella genomosp. 7]OZI22132.1 hypothetical protein CAL19_10840 [Bordetella genomosp. 7]